MVNQPKQTPLYQKHLDLGAKMVPFAGYSMPVQYSGIKQEHEAVRKSAGLFDVSHMGNFFVTGKDARAFLQRVTVNNVDKLQPMDAQYSALCYENGAVVDDILVYFLGGDEYKLVVNASNIKKDFDWLIAHKLPQMELHDASEELCILSLQGPKAVDIAESILGQESAGIANYKAGRAVIDGVNTLFSRTGYTGEDGFEFYPANRQAPALWAKILEEGQRHGILPVGLGARDTLRLEAGLSLYGHELTDKTNLIEAGLAWITDFTKGDFLGRAALEAKAKNGPAVKMVGLELLELAIPREGCAIRAKGAKGAQGTEIGVITSGTMSPTLGKGIALGYVQAGSAKPGTEVEIVVRDVGKKAKVTSRYFYKRQKAAPVGAKA